MSGGNSGQDTPQKPQVAKQAKQIKKTTPDNTGAADGGGSQNGSASHVPDKLKECDKLRATLQTSLTKGSSLVKEICKNPKWNHANNPQNLGCLKQELSDLEQRIDEEGYGSWLTNELRDIQKETECKNFKKLMDGFCGLQAPTDAILSRMNKLWKKHKIENS